MQTRRLMQKTMIIKNVCSICIKKPCKTIFIPVEYYTTLFYWATTCRIRSFASNLYVTITAYFRSSLITFAHLCCGSTSLTSTLGRWATRLSDPCHIIRNKRQPKNSRLSIQIKSILWNISSIYSTLSRKRRNLLEFVACKEQN